MTRHQRMQKIIKQYKLETGKKEVDLHDVAAWAVKRGWKLPVPQNPVDILAKEFSAAAREEIRYDKATNKPYRVNHALRVKQGGAQLTLWIDIDEAARKPMVKSLTQRREQMVGDGLQLTLDADHWNGVHRDEEPIQLPLDFGPDIEWRKNAPDETRQRAS